MLLILNFIRIKRSENIHAAMKEESILPHDDEDDDVRITTSPTPIADSLKTIPQNAPASSNDLLNNKKTMKHQIIRLKKIDKANIPPNASVLQVDKIISDKVKTVSNVPATVTNDTICLDSDDEILPEVNIRGSEPTRQTTSNVGNTQGNRLINLELAKESNEPTSLTRSVTAGTKTNYIVINSSDKNDATLINTINPNITQNVQGSFITIDATNANDSIVISPHLRAYINNSSDTAITTNMSNQTRNRIDLNNQTSDRSLLLNTTNKNIATPTLDVRNSEKTIDTANTNNTFTDQPSLLLRTQLNKKIIGIKTSDTSLKILKRIDIKPQSNKKTAIQSVIDNEIEAIKSRVQNKNKLISNNVPSKVLLSNNTTKTNNAQLESNPLDILKDVIVIQADDYENSGSSVKPNPPIKSVSRDVLKTTISMPSTSKNTPSSTITRTAKTNASQTKLYKVGTPTLKINTSTNKKYDTSNQKLLGTVDLTDLPSMEMTKYTTKLSTPLNTSHKSSKDAGVKTVSSVFSHAKNTRYVFLYITYLINIFIYCLLRVFLIHASRA